jgi:hypothetical protein
MRFALVGPTLEENLSIGYLAAALRAAGHECVTVPFAWDRERAQARRRILAARPDAVGLSMTFQARGRSCLALAAELRAEGFAGPVIAGGHWASLAAAEILRDHPAVDLVLRGEAERSIVELAEALAGRGELPDVPGIVWRDPPGSVREGTRPPERAPLDDLPRPARDAPPLARLGIPWAPLLASRGCRSHCSFCSIAAFHRLGCGPARRVREPERVADEMAALWHDRGVRIFVFHDDDFFLGRREDDVARIGSLAAAMAAHRLPRVALMVKARPDDVHEDVIRDLRELGLVRMFLGVENDAPNGLRALGRGVDPQRNHRAVALLHRQGILVSSNLLLWEPDATLDDLRANLSLMRSFPDQLFNAGRAEAYEGAPLTLRLAGDGRLLGDYLGRDYRVRDPRAELAFRIHRLALGERCYPLDGLVNTANSVAYDAHLLLHFLPSDRAERLREDVAAWLRRLAGSLAAWLECIVDYSSTVPLGAEPDVVRFALDASRAVRAEDARLRDELHALEERIERCAHGLPDPSAHRAEPPRGRSRRAATLLVAAAGALACSKGGTAGGRASEEHPQSLALDAGPAETAALADASAVDAPVPDAPPAEAAAPVESDAIVLSVSPQYGAWQSCPANAHVNAFLVEVRLEAEVDARFDRFAATDGKVEDLYVSPDARRVHGVFRPGEGKGVQRLTAVFARGATGAGTLFRSQQLFHYGDGEATLGPDEVPDVECGVICDPMAVPPDTVLERAGDVIFGREPWGQPGGWAQTFSFSVGLRADIAGELAGPPAVECSTGSASVGTIWGQGIAEPKPGETWPNREGPQLARDVYRVSFDPRAADAAGRLQAGEQTCTAKFTVRRAGTERVYEGRMHFRIAPDGTVNIGSDAPVPPPLPDEPAAGGAAARLDVQALPYRYAVDVRCLADYGDTLLLEALCPATAALGPATFRWSASGGSIEPVDGGARALWRLPDDAATAVAVCAVQARPLDLQIGSYRRG